MGSKKLLITGAAIAVVAAAAILVPSIAAGVPLPGVIPVSTAVTSDDGPGGGPGNNGRGNASGHNRDSEDFPGNNGKGKPDASHDVARGNAFGHQKDSPAFPGNNGRGHDHQQGGADSSTDD